MRLNWHKVLPKGNSAVLRLLKIVNESKLDSKLIELVNIRASQINGCARCLEIHTKNSIALGESKLRLSVLSAWKDTSLFTERERAALAWCEELTNISTTGASDQVYEETAQLFTPEELVELTILIVSINSLNRLTVGFRTDVGNYVSHKKN